ncbi:General transcription and DNA repair factor IIH helicase subunit xpb1 [Orobanche gracilis]
MIAFGGKRSEESEKIIEDIRNREWGLLLMDEVHVVPAHMFRKVISLTSLTANLGSLVSTLVREDERITDLNFLIGPKLYEANWLDLVKGGFIANVQCAEVWCPMTKEFFAEYLKKENSKKKQRGDKIIVFADNLFALTEYAWKLKKPMIYGATSHPERTKILDAFKTSRDVNTIFPSKVGDNSISIPEANVIIQISSHAGSRRQEAQRLGRILRDKGKPQDRVVGGKEEYNAFFYSLVSTDTQEIYYSTRRQQFLIDQGYSNKLEKMGVGDDAVGLEQLEEDEDGDAFTKARRSAKFMSAMSGAKGMVYMEFGKEVYGSQTQVIQETFRLIDKRQGTGVFKRNPEVPGRDIKPKLPVGGVLNAVLSVFILRLHILLCNY